MQNNQYQRMATYVVNAVGLSIAYSVKGGVVQGGGMDPFFYTWSSFIIACSVEIPQGCASHTMG